MVEDLVYEGRFDVKVESRSLIVTGIYISVVLHGCT